MSAAASPRNRAREIDAASGKSRSAITRRAPRGSWPFTRGAVFEYDAEELRKRAATSKPRHREEGEFRAHVLREVEALVKRKGLSFLAAARQVARLAGCTDASIHNWWYGTACRSGARLYAPVDRAAALIPRWRGRQRSEIPPKAWAYFVALHLDRDRPTVAASYRRTCKVEEAGDWGALPSVRTFRSRVRTDLSPELLSAAREGMRDAVYEFVRKNLSRGGRAA